MGTNFQRKILTLTLLPLPLVLAICALLVWQILQQQQSSQWVSHTRDVLSNVYLGERYLIDQETGLRGYMHTAEPRFLEPYNAGQPKFEETIANLRHLTADNPSQQQRLDELEKSYRTWLAQSLPARQSITAHSPGVCDPQCLAGALQRKAEMDGMRAMADQIEAEELRLLRERQAKVRRERSFSIATIVISLSILAVILVVFISRTIRRIDAIYSKALADRDQSIQKEQRARAAAEALAEEIKEQSGEMERLYRQVRAERDSAQSRLAELGLGR
jgi:methyl-accepting chemotaxis protein